MKLVTLLSLILAAAVVAAVLFPLYGSGSSISRNTLCLSNVKQLSIGTIMYASDSDERFPSRDDWSDAIYPYTKRWEVYHCPLVKDSPWGYAYNGALDRAKPKGDPKRVPLIYDSVNRMKNASDLVASLPAVPRHKKNSVSYADGHAKSLARGAKP